MKIEPVSQTAFMKRNSDTSASNSGRESFLMTPEDVAVMFYVERRTVLKWAREGKIDCIRPSRKIVLFNREYINSLGRSSSQDIESRTTRNKNDRARNSSSPRKEGERKASGKSWRSLREEVTKCQ